MIFQPGHLAKRHKIRVKRETAVKRCSWTLAMVRLAYNYPTVESTELLETYARTSPRLYSSIATADKYLLRYASNTWEILFPNCTVHPPTGTVRIPLPFTDGNAQVFHLDVPYQGLASLGFSQQPGPDANVITLGSFCEVYFLAESIIVRLPGTHSLSFGYPQLPRDGLAFSLSYTEILSHKIKDNLTKLGLCVQGTEGQQLHFILYPLQRFPPQPLVAGVFQCYADLTPLQSLQLVDDAITQGTDLVKKMAEYARSTMVPGHLDRSSSAASTTARSMSGAPYSTDSSVGIDTEMVLSQTGQGDDDAYDDYNYADSMGRTESSVGMHVEMVGGFNSTGVKRARRESDEVMPGNDPLKHKRLYSPSI